MPFLPHQSAALPGRQGRRVLTLTTLALLGLFTTSFAVATALGWTDEAALQAQLLALGAPRPLMAGMFVLLLTADLLLPVPSTVVMAVSGMVFGKGTGAVINGVGSVGGALLGYLLCRRFGAAAFQRFVGEQDLPGLRARFETRGAWVVILSRAVPMVTETVSCLAGLVGMPLPLFLALTVAGSVPLGFVYAWAGAELGAAAGIGGPVLLALALQASGFAGWKLSGRWRP
jgi:uncharacterized membrane protein YdjX (TVP38/TMEM64 family)